MTKPLEGKVALVTGGSRGIGAAIVRKLAEQGATVAFTYSKSKDVAEPLAKEVKGAAYLADADKPDTMKALVETVLKAHGKIDILVNNAGVFTVGTIGETTFADYQHQMRVNVDAVFALTNEVVKHLPAGGRIVNISSCLGARASGGMMSNYVASKFAVSGFSRAWAKDLGAKNITVNAVLPGPIDTEMNPANSGYSEWQRSQTAMGRYGKPEEVAAAVAFLVSPEASYITGAELTVDGGWNA